jgi:Concanavalin A-like lectin/glucanases superfamily
MATSTFTVTRDNTSFLSNPLTVDLIVGGTATFGVDYTVSGAATFTTTTASVVIPAGALNATIVVTTVPDLVFEADETVILSIVPFAGVLQAVVNPAATFTILNDDASLGDPLFASVVFSMLPIGIDNSTVFTDNSSYGRIITTVGDTKIVGNAAIFDGSGDYLTIPTSISLSMGSGDFCIETQIQTIQSTLYAAFLTRGNPGFSSGSWSLLIGPSGKLVVYLANFSGSSPILTSTTTINDGVPRHIAWNRSSGINKLYIQGVAEDTVSSLAVMPDAGTPLCLGNDLNFGGRNYSGKIKFARITAASRYPNNFIPLIF